MTASNVGPQYSTVNTENRLREINVMEMDLRTLSRVLIGYFLAIAPLVAVSTGMFGLKATFWGLAIFHFGCFLAVLAIWWQEERQWSRIAGSNDPFVIRSALVSTPYLRQGRGN